MATAWNERRSICDEIIVDECQRSEIKRLRKPSGEIMAGAVSSTTTSVSCTTLQDLPNEVLDYILMKAVVKKVMDKKLAKSAWSDYASRVIQPMRTVWSQWNYSLTTRWFKIVLLRNLNKKDPAAISVATFATRPSDLNFSGFVKLGNQMYSTCGCYNPDRPNKDCNEFDYYCLRVFEIQDLMHYTKSIPLPIVTEEPSGLAACKRSNSIYIWGCGPDVFRLMIDGNGGFEVLRWPAYSLPSDAVDCSDTKGKFYYRIDSFLVLDGNLLVKRCVIPEEFVDDDYDSDKEEEIVFSVQNPDGLVIQNTKLSPIHSQSSNVVMKCNGNFVYADLKDKIVREVDPSGKEIRNFHLIGKGLCFVDHLLLDSYDRVMLLHGFDLMFLDEELNFLEVVQLEPSKTKSRCDDGFLDACFDKETNEMIIIFVEFKVVFIKLKL